MAEQTEYQKSVQYSIDRAKASLEELSNDLLSSSFLKKAIDIGNDFINLLDAIINKIDVLPTLMAGIGVALNKMLGYCKVHLPKEQMVLRGSVVYLVIR
jgi:hypothetical protein